jgi:hypothetical protein
MSFPSKIITMVLLMSIVIQQSFAEIREIKTISSLLEYIKHTNPSDTLVAFDIDYVLIIPEDFYSMNRNPDRKKIWSQLKKEISHDEARLLHSIVTANAKWKIVEPEIIDIFSYLKNAKFKTIGLTSLGTGQLGIIQNREDLRLKELQSVGLDFLQLEGFKDYVVLDNLKTDDGVPMLKHGIIFTSEQDKATILELILEYKGYYPKKIIFIDDIKENLLSVENLCKKLNIDFTGFHYTAVSQMPSLETEEEIERVRFKILRKQGKWFSDEEIKEISN